VHGNDLGFGVGPNCLFRMGCDVVRSPSLAYIAWDKDRPSDNFLI